MEPSAAFPLHKRVSSEGETAKNLLRTMHKVISHDLPNQILVLQTLLQMLEIEESDRLSDDGREQLQRLQSTIFKASRMVRFLKEMSRLQSCVVQRDLIPLDHIIRDVRAELYQRFPDAEIELTWHPTDGSVVADQRFLTLAIVEFLGTTLMDSIDPRFACWKASADGQHGDVELRFWTASSNGAVNHLTRPPAERRVMIQSMEMQLAAEWLKLAGGTLIPPVEASPWRQFTIVLSGETIHG